MTDARRENIRTLAAMLGTTEGEAATLLDVEVLLTVDSSANRLGATVQMLLERTLTNVATEFFTSPSLEIVIGNASPRSRAPTLGVSARGSSFAIHDGPPLSYQGATCSAVILDLFAACYVAAAAVQRATGIELPMPLHLPMEIDIRDFFGVDLPLPERRVDLGTMYLAGAGAIGNGFLLGLSAFQVRGQLHICDPDDASEGNLNRCILFSPEDVGKNKALRLALRARDLVPELHLVPHQVALNELPAAKDGGAWLDTLVVAVDSRRVRRRLQNEIPRRVFDASTTGVSEVVVHFNRVMAEYACLSCIYYEAPDETAHEQHVAKSLGVTVTDVRSNFVSPDSAAAIARKYPLAPERLVGLAYDSLFKQLCGQGALKTAADKQVLAPFAFVSVLAGVLLATELVRRADSPTTELPFNYWRISPYGHPVLRAQELRPRRQGCEFCDNQLMQKVVRQLWGSRGK